MSVSSFAKFLGKYANEALATANALTSILDGLALAPKENAKVKAVIETLETAAENVAKAAKAEAKAPVVQINKKDIQDAIKSIMPEIVAAVVAAQEAKAKANA